MDSFVATGAPTSPLAHLSIVGNPANQNAATRLGLLEMALQTQIGIPFGKKLGVNAAVRRMAGGAAFAQRLMFKHKRPFL